MACVVLSLEPEGVSGVVVSLVPLVVGPLGGVPRVVEPLGWVGRVGLSLWRVVVPVVVITIGVVVDLSGWVPGDLPLGEVPGKVVLLWPGVVVFLGNKAVVVCLGWLLVSKVAFCFEVVCVTFG